MIAGYTVHRGHIEHPDGGASIVLRTGELDLDSMDPARRRSTLAGFAALCHGLETPLQLLIRTRPIVGGTHPVDASPLERAMHGHRAARGALSRPHWRDILLVVRGPTPGGASDIAYRLAEAVRSMGVSAERVSDDALRLLMADLSTTPWSERVRSLAIGGTHMAGYGLRRLPGHAVSAGWLRPLLSVETACDISIHLEPASLGVALRSLGRRLRDFAAHRMLENERGTLGDVHVDIALDAAHALRGRLARHHGRALHLSLTALVIAESAASLADGLQRVRTAFHAALVVPEPLHFRHRAARLSTLPLGIDPAGMKKLVDSTAVATCTPWFQTTCDEAGGYRLGVARSSNAPVAVAPFDATLHANANIALLAASGHGKSFTLGALVLEAWLRGVDSIIVDPEDEHRSLALATGGTHLSLVPGTGCAVNVFDGADADEESAVAAVTELAGIICGRLADADRAHVDQAARDALRRAREQHRVAVLADCLPHLDDRAPIVAAVMRRYCTGALGQQFNQPSTLRLGSGVTAISLRDMPSEHTPAATFLLSRALWTLVRAHPRRRHIVFDEAGALCSHPALRALLVQLARRCRKHGASLVVATQNAQDLLATDEGTVVATNCATVLLGGQRPADTARMEHAFGLTAAQRRFLETAARGEFLLLAGSRRLEIRVDVPEVYARVLRVTGPSTVG